MAYGIPIGERTFLHRRDAFHTYHMLKTLQRFKLVKMISESRDRLDFIRITIWKGLYD